jgi:hypothetical protein
MSTLSATNASFSRRIPARRVADLDKQHRPVELIFRWTEQYLPIQTLLFWPLGRRRETKAWVAITGPRWS